MGVQRLSEYLESIELGQVAEPLDARQRKRRAGPAWEREKEITDLGARLREEKINILLTGESGAGKTTIAMAAARRIAGVDGRERPRVWMNYGLLLWEREKTSHPPRYE